MKPEHAKRKKEIEDSIFYSDIPVSEHIVVKTLLLIIDRMEIQNELLMDKLYEIEDAIRGK